MSYKDIYNQVMQEYEEMGNLISKEKIEFLISKVTGIEPCILEDDSVGLILKF